MPAPAAAGIVRIIGVTGGMKNGDPADATSIVVTGGVASGATESGPGKAATLAEVTRDATRVEAALMPIRSGTDGGRMRPAVRARRLRPHRDRVATKPLVARRRGAIGLKVSAGARRRSRRGGRRRRRDGDEGYANVRRDGANGNGTAGDTGGESSGPRPQPAPAGDALSDRPEGERRPVPDFGRPIAAHGRIGDPRRAAAKRLDSVAVQRRDSRGTAQRALMQAFAATGRGPLPTGGGACLQGGVRGSRERARTSASNPAAACSTRSSTRSNPTAPP